MNEFLIAAFTAFLGMITYVIGQIVVKLFDPAYDLRAHFGAIARDLYLYANRHPKIATDEERLKIFSQNREYNALFRNSQFATERM
jgi:hypothetical protein